MAVADGDTVVADGETNRWVVDGDADGDWWNIPCGCTSTSGNATNWWPVISLFADDISRYVRKTLKYL